LSRVTKTLQAEQDLEDIWFHIALDRIPRLSQLPEASVLPSGLKARAVPERPSPLSFREIRFRLALLQR
jgi:hypothetical protein